MIREGWNTKTPTTPRTPGDDWLLTSVPETRRTVPHRIRCLLLALAAACGCSSTNAADTAGTPKERNARVATPEPTAATVRVKTAAGSEWGLVDSLENEAGARGLRVQQFEVGQDSGSFWLLDADDRVDFVITEGIGNRDAWMEVQCARDAPGGDSADELLRSVLARFVASDAAVR